MAPAERPLCLDGVDVEAEDGLDVGDDDEDVVDDDEDVVDDDDEEDVVVDVDNEGGVYPKLLVSPILTTQKIQNE
jgi:hypothetical protein